MTRTHRALLFGLVGLALLATAAAVASASCTISIVVSPNELTAFIDEERQDSVTFQGNYAISASPDIADQIDFTATVSTGWLATVSPESDSPPSDGSSRPFNVTVLVPAGVESSAIGEVHVIARAFAGGSECGHGDAVARVIPGLYFGVVTMTITPRVADVDPVTLVATVDLRIRVETNAGHAVLARLTVRVNDGLRHDAPEDVQLTPVEPGFVGALVVVHFTAPNNQVRSYTASVFATVAEPNRGGGNVFQMYTISVSVPAPHMENGIVALTIVGGVGSVIVVGAAWAKGRPGMRRVR